MTTNLIPHSFPDAIATLLSEKPAQKVVQAGLGDLGLAKSAARFSRSTNPTLFDVLSLRFVDGVIKKLDIEASGDDLMMMQVDE